MDWTSIVKDFEKSGLSVRQFAKEKNITEHRLGYYLRKLKKAPEVTPKFVPLKIAVPKTIDPVWLAKFLKEVWRAEG